MTDREPTDAGGSEAAGTGPQDGAAVADGRGLPYPASAEEAERMEHRARDAERHIGDLHDEGDPGDRPIYEE